MAAAGRTIEMTGHMWPSLSTRKAHSSGTQKPNKAAQIQKDHLSSYKIPQMRKKRCLMPPQKMKLRAALELYLTGKQHTALPEAQKMNLGIL